MAVKIQIRRDTAANWSSNNPTLDVGELGLDTTNNILKAGDGSAAWNSLSDVAGVEHYEDIVGAMVSGNTESGITVTYQDSDGTLDFAVASQTDENFTTADHDKLDGIEASATADQSDAEIRTAVEAASDSNVFTDADHSKLGGIEASATADQTAAQIKAAYEGEANAFTDAQFTKLANIETAATADQTNAEIKAAVEAATDSNTFTDADHSKLGGIEASADVTDTTNVTDAGALMDSEVTNLAAVKAFDGSDYATAAQGTTADAALPKAGGAMTGAITTNSTFDGRDVSTDGTKLDGIETGATADQTKADIEGLGIDLPAANLTGTIAAARLSTATTQLESDDSTKIATTAYVVDKITTLIGGAPSTLNDLNELAAAINDDAAYNTTLTTALATKLPKAGGAMTGAITTNSTFDGRDVATDGTKLDTVETNADVTDTTNVTDAGALMDSEVTNLSQVKAFDSSDYATAAQGTTADDALPLAGGTLTGALTGTSGTFSGDMDVNKLVMRDMGDYITFYGTNTANHSISSRNNVGDAADDLRINSYGALYVNLDSNDNNTSGADFVIGNHGSSNSTLSELFRVSGETGNLTLSGTVDGRDVATDGSKLDGIESGADVTDTTNVTDAGALMDSEVTNLAQVKAFDSSDYATATQGTTADDALPKAGGAMTGNLDLGDWDYLRLGDGNDLKIVHDGSDSLIQNTGTGSLVLSTTILNVLNGSVTEYMLKATENSSVDIYYDGVKKLATTSTGIDVTGNITVSGTVDGRDVATDGSKLDGIESGADVTDATNVASAGAVMEGDTTTASMSFVIDEDNMVSDLATKIPTQQSVKAYVDSQVASKDNTDEITEGSTNLYFTDTRARGAVSVTDSGGDGSLAYNSGTGVVTYTGPSASDVRAHFSGGTGVSISSGTVAIGQAVGTSDDVTFGTVDTGILEVDSKKILDMPSNSNDRGPWNPIVTAMRNSGTKIHRDEDFDNGLNGVVLYNNSGGGTVAVSRVTDASESLIAPNHSGYVVKIVSNGGTTSPGLGGFQQPIAAEENHTFVQIFQAKIPTGYSLSINENSQGTNNTSYWMTNSVGTGKWEWYARVSHCGDSGTFSSGGHVSLSGSAGAVTWHLASCTVVDISESQDLRIDVYDSTGTLLN